ncbi:hypothetical protein TURU_002933 [Turdus rufiventris]|nr:hypothetical protein TURU_002933 [Turdus rufiventris]
MLLVIVDFLLRVAEVPIYHLDLSREVFSLLEAHIRNATKTLPHLVKPEDYHALLLFHTELGCNKEFAKYQKGLHILQKDVEGIRTTSSVLLYTPGWRLGTQKEDEWTKRMVDCMAGAMLRVLASVI